VGWYLRKSLRLGPLRINLSKSGIGASVGVTGLRVGTGPKGPYLHGGREGLYFKESLSKRTQQITAPEDTQREPTGSEEAEHAAGEEQADAHPTNKANGTPVIRQIGSRLLRGILGGLMRR
jgi:hypothetical protein